MTDSANLSLHVLIASSLAMLFTAIPARSATQPPELEASSGAFSQPLPDLRSLPYTRVPTGATKEKVEPQFEATVESRIAPGPSAISNTAVGAQEIELRRPELKALISVNEYLSPLSLEATSREEASLRSILELGMARNLDLGIFKTGTRISKFAYLSTLGKFLPDTNLGFNDFFTKGKINIPATGFGPTAVGASNPLANIRLDSPILVTNAGFRYYGYRGGKTLFGALQAKHNYKAAQAEQSATANDTIMGLVRDYYNLVLNEALLQIRVKSVSTSEEQLKNNSNLYAHGLATNLDVLQSKTQLARDRKALVDQQIARRLSSLDLTERLNIDLGTDVIPTTASVRMFRLIDPKLSVSDLLRIAIDHRSELKQYEQQRLAAKNGVLVAQSPLHPTVALSGTVLGIGPPKSVAALYVLGLSINWNVGGLGTSDLANIQSARWQARQSLLKANKEVVTVLKQVHTSLLQSLDTERTIQETTDEVASATEELRLARLRFKSGLGTNLDVITAQRDYTTALIDKAQAIINFNIAQAQLVHDVGMISVDALTSGRLLTKTIGGTAQ